MFIVGAYMCDLCFNIVYVYRIDKNIDSFFNRVVNGLHYMFLMVSFIGLMETYFVVAEQLGLKYWIAWTDEIRRVLKKVKQYVTDAL